MKKIITSAFISLILSGILPLFTFAAETNLIEDAQIIFKSAENPNRLEISFNLTEPINLSQENSNIIFEYFRMNSDKNLESINYIKEKSWSGYLNSYDDYPAGERKYSSGLAGGDYSDTVPDTRIYTSTRTGSSIDTSEVAAVRITVLRENTSGEKITLYSDGTISHIEKIETPIVIEKDEKTGIILEAITSNLPLNTMMVAIPMTSGSDYEQVKTLLADSINFVAVKINLVLDGNHIQPNGKVKVSIPIPANFNNSNLIVYRIDEYGVKNPYSVEIVVNGGVEYAMFKTSHFSTYVLAEIPAEDNSQTAEEDKPKKSNGNKSETASQNVSKAETQNESKAAISNDSKTADENESDIVAQNESNEMYEDESKATSENESGIATPEDSQITASEHVREETTKGISEETPPVSIAPLNASTPESNTGQVWIYVIVITILLIVAVMTWWFFKKLKR